MSVTLSRPDMTVPEKLPDSRQTLAERQCPAGEGVTTVVKTDLQESCLLPHEPP